jgi:hypothetical protein
MSPHKLSRRSFLKLAAASTSGLVLMGSAGLAYAHEIEPDWVDITRLSLRLPRLPRTFHGLRLVQISDIHLGGWMTGERLAPLIELVNQQEADVIAITGDFVSNAPAYYEHDLRTNLSALKAREMVVAVLGNHDHWNDPDKVEKILTQSNVLNLKNTTTTLRQNGALLHLAGVDSYMEGKARLDIVTKQTPKGSAAILLAHEPDFADISSVTGRFDLQISGHSHGGQIVLPLIGAPFLPRYARKYVRGLYTVNGMLHYTNRGLGMVHIHLRLNCRPEITVFTLEAG